MRADIELFRACSGSTYIKIGTIQRRLAWPLRKDDTQIREAFQIFVFPPAPPFFDLPKRIEPGFHTYMQCALFKQRCCDVVRCCCCSRAEELELVWICWVGCARAPNRFCVRLLARSFGWLAGWEFQVRVHFNWSTHVGSFGQLCHKIG